MSSNDCKVTKTRETAGADERSPSKSQYFSWINSTNEGSNESQSLANLNYFKWLRDEYGMGLDIYAWDAGNLDGSAGTYQTLDSEKIKKQYPRGYTPIGKLASEIGTKLGVWCGPDGFGNTPEEAAARHELMVSLCRDYNFGLFKMDAVCSGLREEKQDNFIRMMKECRKYSPELILLNHRLRFGKGEPYSTTFLLGGQETYVDVHLSNHKCAPHHREFIFHRSPPPGLTRLTEDHGTCISSCVDYFEDDLIYQAFNRCLILAPEIYGNPWLMRDEEHARLARIFNLHRTYRDILIDGLMLPENYGKCYPISRGNGNIRFIVSGNDSWDPMNIFININEEIGLKRGDGEYVVSIHHPYEQFIGKFRYGDRAKIEIPPFRAILVEVARADKAYPMLTNCAYEVLHETNNVPDKVKIYKVFGKVEKLVEGKTSDCPENLRNIEAFDNTEGYPIMLTYTWDRPDIPENIEQLFETAQFAMDNDSLEYRELLRSGETSIPQVKAARDEFFAQETYKLRGLESRLAFDGKSDTFFGCLVSPYLGRNSVGGGSLRVDFGKVYDADYVMIEFFSVDSENVPEIPKQKIENTATVSTDLNDWKTVYLDELKRIGNVTMSKVVNSVHNIVPTEGARKQVTYAVGGKLRYFRLETPLSRIYKIALIKDGCEIELSDPKALNLLPTFASRTVAGYSSTTVKIPDELRHSNSFLAVAINGEHGREGVYVVAELDGKLYGCPDRSASYPVNSWECSATDADSNYTYYLPITNEMKGRDLKLHVIEMTEACAKLVYDVFVCESHDERDGIVSNF
ncbi:MAG: hypothetical protein IKM46_02585 [Clostridia bacterium]|nr:hypothetical protein [Clostridia bacterium]